MQMELLYHCGTNKQGLGMKLDFGFWENQNLP
jgi:hypothetical protein